MEDKVALYELLVASHPDAVLKGDTIPYTSLNGHMYTMLSKDGVVAIRLPDPSRTEFLKKYNTQLDVQYGIVRKEYVVVPDALLKKTKELKKYFELSHQYVASLKPKPGKKK
ncbi:MAG: hypothetical protein H0X33_07560 [Taibaiella sp.]|nr:hypothetical protein [Taibaiella sp.]